MEKESPKKKLNKSSLQRALKIFTYIKPYKYTFIVGLLFLFLSSGTSLAFPMLLGNLVDTEGLGNINKLALVLLLIFAGNAVFSFFRIYLFEKVTQNALALLRQDTYNHLIQLPLQFFNSRRVGELNSRISADIAQLQTTFTTTTAEFLRQIIIILGGVVLLATISVQLTLFMLAIVPVIAIIAVIFGKFIRKLSKQTQEIVAESNTIVEETLQGIANVKAFANEFFEKNRYQSATQRIADVAIKTSLYRGAFVSFIIFGLFGSIIGVIWYGLVLKNEGLMSDGDLFSFVLYTVFVGASIGGIADLYAQLIKAIGSSENLLDILDEEKEPLELSAVSESVQLKGEVTFKDLFFSYPSRKDLMILKGLNFTGNAGEKVALVGSSGAGKSTIINLLLRFYLKNSGEILIDGKQIEDYDLIGLRRNMAIVPQEVMLFGGSIRENIAYGKPDATELEIIEAAKQANADEFVRSFPEAYDTIVGDRGIQLSGGQRQRIAIARAVLKNPSILILDEATSSLDAESEKLVQEALEKLMKGRTSFIIAHRLATIRNADKILVLRDGLIIEEGTHKELYANESGFYRSLSDLQFQDSSNQKVSSEY